MIDDGKRREPARAQRTDEARTVEAGYNGKERNRHLHKACAPHGRGDIVHHRRPCGAQHGIRQAKADKGDIDDGKQCHRNHAGFLSFA